MAKQKSAQTQQTPRQLRRQQQRENAVAAPLLPAPSSADLLGPSLLVPLYCACIVIGYLLLARGVATLKGNELSAHQAIFTSVNAATLTGFQQARNPDDYTPAGQGLILALTFAGTLFSFICGGSAVVRIARLRFSTAHLLFWACGFIAFAWVGGGFALSIHTDRTLFQSIFQAASAFGNSGLALGPLPITTGAQTTLVLLPLVVLGGLGLPVLMDLTDRLRGKGKVSSHTRTVLIWTAGTYIFTTAILFLLSWSSAQPGLSFSSGSAFARSAAAVSSFSQTTLIEASQQAINARSAGFAFRFASHLPQAITFVLIGIMIIGGSPAGSAGGLKVTTLALLSRGTRDVLHNRPVNRGFGVALIWLLVYLSMLGISTLTLLICEPDMHLDRTLFLAASALGNVGLSHEPVVVSTAGLYVLSMTMLLGRVAPVMMLWYIVDTTRESTVAVG